MKFVAVIIQNRSDYEKMKPCFDLFETFSVRYELIVSCPLRSKQRTQSYVQNACKKGAEVFITASDEPEYLSACVASETIHPVLSICLNHRHQQGFQTPNSIAVAHIQLNQKSVSNVAYFAMQILALHDKELAAKLIEDRIVQQQEVSAFSKEIETLI